jgi:hypothetical protein
VAQKFLHGTQICAAVEEMRCKTVTKAVGRDSCRHAGVAQADLQPATDDAWLQRLSSLSEEQARGLPVGAASEKLRSTTVEIAPQRSRRVLTYGHNASAATFPFHAYLFLVQIYGREAQLDQFAGSQSTRIRQFEHRAIAHLQRRGGPDAVQ